MKTLAPIPPSDREVEEIIRLVNTGLGFKYNISKKHLIISRLNRRLIQLKLGNYREYLEYLHAHPQEQDTLFELITTNITSFFREPKQFEYLQTRLLPELKENKKTGTKLRCWSAGCSSGEEPYSIAISCLETLGPGWDVKVLASDINTIRLKMGTEGKYHTEQLKTVPPTRLRKYFHPLKDEAKELNRVTPGLRQKIFFRQMNLLDDSSLPPFIRFSFIFCRNVFIYLNDQAKEELLAIFYRRLNPGGHLFLGHSESINTAVDNRWLLLGNSINQKKDR